MSIDVSSARAGVAIPDSAAEYPFVVISILNWNGWQDTLGCLESVCRQDYPNYLTVVVDNGSLNDSVERITTWAKENLGPDHVLAEYTRETALVGGDPSIELSLDQAPSPARVVLVRNKENLGFGAGNNTTIAYALARKDPAGFAFLVNNDAKIGPGCLKELVRVALESGAGITGATVLDPATGQSKYPGLFVPTAVLISPSGRRIIPRPEGLRWFPAPSAHGEAVLLSTPLMADLRSFRGACLREDVFMYCEELDLALEAVRLGHKIVLSSGAVAFHKSGSSGGFTIPYYQERARVLLCRSVFSGWRRLWFELSNPLLTVVRAVRLFARGRLTAALCLVWGQMDGYRGITGKWRRHDAFAAHP